MLLLTLIWNKISSAHIFPRPVNVRMMFKDATGRADGNLLKNYPEKILLMSGRPFLEFSIEDQADSVSLEIQFYSNK